MKFFKNWPDWKKGGTIGLVLYAVFYFLGSAYFINNIVSYRAIRPIFILPVSWPTLFIEFRIYPALPLAAARDISNVLVLVLYLALGILLGWLYGKIKNRGKNIN